MESLAYLEIALAHDQSQVTSLNSTKNSTKRLKNLTFLNLSRGIQCSVLLLAVLLSCLGTAKVALAQSLLELGVRSSDVTSVQRRLRELGFFNQALTDYYGIDTQNAVIRFQQARGLNPDGKVGANTRAALFTYDYEVRTLPPVPSFPTTPLPPPSNVAVSNSTTPTVLREGDRGEAVRRLQDELRERGVYFGRIDGVYGENTEQAVRDFQRGRGLRADGIAGTETLSALGLITRPGRQTADLPYVVVIPDPNATLLAGVRQFFGTAFLADSRRGQYVNAGSFPDYETAASRSYALRARGFNARVVHF